MGILPNMMGRRVRNAIRQSTKPQRVMQRIEHQFAMIRKVGVDVDNRRIRILEFGCGAGKTVYGLLDAGYINTLGYDITDYLELRSPSDRTNFVIGTGMAKLPFDDDSFDLIISDQVFEHVKDPVSVFRELLRITRPGGHGLHIFPARYCPIEPHTFVPFGGVLAHRWWYKLWAMLGVRNQFQQNCTANETADLNSFYFVDGLNYVSNSCYGVVWARLGCKWLWLEQHYFDTGPRRLTRAIGRMNRVLPLIGWLYRTFLNRLVYLRKER